MEMHFYKCQEQVIWCVEGGVDYIIGESFDSYGEAQLALRAIKEYGKGKINSRVL
jgi:phage FluMu gp28-like protein